MKLEIMSPIIFSKTAIAEIKRMQAKQKSSTSCLQVAVKAGGCSGLYYELSFVEASDPSDSTSIQHTHDGIQVQFDRQTYNYIDGLTLDYSEDLMGGGFRFHNPNAIATCGCGNSFAVEA